MRIGPVLLLTAIVCACLAAGAALAATFTDPIGDTIVIPEGADVSTVTPVDITAVDVTNTADGLVTFRITVTNQTLPPFTIIGPLLDADRNGATGSEGLDVTLDFIVEGDGTTALDFTRWNGSDFVSVPQTAATASFAAGILTITVPRSELLNTRGFDFFAVALAFRADFEAIVADGVPDAADNLTYELVGVAPDAPPTLAATRPTGTPARPAAGGRFVVSTVARRLDTGATLTAGRVTCAARIGPARLRATGSFAAGRARCAMTLPRTAGGKTLRGTMTIRSAGATVARPFSFRVR